HEKAKALAEEGGITAVESPIQAHLYVNATGASLENPAHPDVRLETQTGLQMWRRQAAKQQALWLSSHRPLSLPSSKSQTLRAILFGALGSGRSNLTARHESH